VSHEDNTGSWRREKIKGFPQYNWFYCRSKFFTITVKLNKSVSHKKKKKCNDSQWNTVHKYGTRIFLQWSNGRKILSSYINFYWSYSYVALLEWCMHTVQLAECCIFFNINIIKKLQSGRGPILLGDLKFCIPWQKRLSIPSLFLFHICSNFYWDRSINIQHEEIWNTIIKHCEDLDVTMNWNKHRINIKGKYNWKNCLKNMPF
jgi:hypothetical protein